jgi:hypothetical protein
LSNVMAIMTSTTIASVKLDEGVALGDKNILLTDKNYPVANQL